MFALAILGTVALRDMGAHACGWSGPDISEMTTFDPKVLGDPTWDGLYYDPFVEGFGGVCDDCLKKAMVTDWLGHLNGAVTAKQWERLLFRASRGELAAFANTVGPAQREKVRAALAFVDLARRVEPLASFSPAANAGNPADLEREALAGLKAAKDPFLKQRYAFQALRLLFYRKSWGAAIAFHEKNVAVLAAPSADLAWRARHYLAGALAHNKQLGRANLELARIHTHAPALSGVAVDDFRPMEEQDWQETLRLAADVREKTELWRLVGVKGDGLAAMEEIAKLDPRSNLFGLLAVREVARIESGGGRDDGSLSPPEVEAYRKAAARLERFVVSIVETPGSDRPWLMELIAGHLAAGRGDLASARAHLARAVAGRPNDALVVSQASASLAMALTKNWKIAPQNEDEIARAMSAIDASFGRTSTVRENVRGRLAQAYLRAGRLVEAELLSPGTVDAGAAARKPPQQPKWKDPRFVRDLIARVSAPRTPFDNFVLDGAPTRPHLEHELGLLYLVDGDYRTASGTFRTTTAESSVLGTDPFVVHIRDCHDCDHTAYANAPWTHASFAARLAQLETRANGTGEQAAEAAFLLGSALYNITWYGNARSVLESSHYATEDTRAAERWYKRAFDLTGNRELKAKAAFMASKCELGRMISDVGPSGRYIDALPVPKKWFPVVKTFSDTAYYREILAECSNYVRWNASH
jgi:hypothetical protein